MLEVVARWAAHRAMASVVCATHECMNDVIICSSRETRANSKGTQFRWRTLGRSVCSRMVGSQPNGPADTFRELLDRSLGETYRIERELGGGGMSRVFLAEERALGRRVVIKVLPPELAAALSAERFRREIHLSARLQHPHIVPVLTAGEVAGLPYYTMPYVEGESLRARIARDGPLAARDAVSILRDVAKALEFAHGRGVIHRDIKPDNILLAGSSAVVTDF